MASHLQSLPVLVIVTLATLMIPTYAQLTHDFYEEVCPQALPTIRSVVHQAIRREKRMGASLLRLHFHDCFVNVSYNNSCAIKLQQTTVVMSSAFVILGLWAKIQNSMTITFIQLSVKN